MIRREAFVSEGVGQVRAMWCFRARLCGVKDSLLPRRQPALKVLPVLASLAGLLLGLLAGPIHADPRVLYEKQSRFGTVVVEENEQGLRFLLFDGVVQSVVKPGDPDHMEIPYVRTLLAALALAGQTRRFLVIGLGGGSLPRFLRQHYPEATIDAVDIDPEVVKVAKKFFGFREDARMHAHVTDGRAYIEKVRKPYDVIFLDAYGSDSVPRHLTTLEFLSAARRATAPDGVVASNLWGRLHNPNYEAMLRTYQEVFKEMHILRVPGSGNIVLIALPTPRSLQHAAIAERAREFSVSHRMRFDLGEIMKQGLQTLPDDLSQSQILRDKQAAGRRF